jgi:hypothetical protein
VIQALGPGFISHANPGAWPPAMLQPEGNGVLSNATTRS